MRITDINCSLGKRAPRQHFSEAGVLLHTLDRYRITQAVVYHADALWNAGCGNARMREIAAASGGRLQACYVLRPNLGGGEMPAAEVLHDRLLDERPAAVRLFPQQDGYPLDRFFCGELLEVLAALRLPVLLEYDGGMCAGLPALTTDFPQLPVVLLRPPIRQVHILMPLLAKIETVLVDCGALTDNGLIEEIVRRHGSRHLLFGSGMPHFLPAGSLGLALYARLTAEDRANILAGNWQRLQEGRA
jgi:predicted TIM-barrel fold metal-dependent hydrolase